MPYEHNPAVFTSAAELYAFHAAHPHDQSIGLTTTLALHDALECHVLYPIQDHDRGPFPVTGFAVPIVHNHAVFTSLAVLNEFVLAAQHEPFIGDELRA